MKYLLDLEKMTSDLSYKSFISDLTSENEPIEALDIKGLPEDKMQELPFKHFDNLEEIRIFDSGIGNFSQQAQYFSNLKSLTVLQTGENNAVGDEEQILSSNIGKANALTNLYICSDKIKYLPDAICQLKNIENLTLSVKGLLPEKLYLLSKLKSFRFDMMSERLDEKLILDTISKLNNLDSFSYTNPFSKRVPDFQDNLLNLENFVFSMLNVSELPTILPRMTKLKYLHLSNSLQTIPEWFVNLKGLEYLTIEGLADGQIPLFLKKLPNLHTINLMACLDVRLDDSRIEQIKNDFPELKILGVNADY
ncbi:leucine-rich repeat domain-containing protein [Microscilla marina]|uniref:Leucine-rich repeat containing protein n=1 Tax=Microscilla marina ATCC 23134 TaxID=313606 RepID=A1ZI23_MICM2|nr:leucine-rich repeat domain-containing protein [Microscilla marina]EAY30180.1 putative protein kinase Xa21 [Microscilla marina ATCC 23134]